MADKLAKAFEQGQNDRRRSVEFKNPYPRGSAEARKYYEGWCEANLIRFLNRCRPV